MSDAIDIAQVRGIVESASEMAMSYFRNFLEIETKGDESPVTVADKAVESDIRAALSQLTPDLGILGEEFGAERLEGNSFWVVDPIDGTRSFISGLPLFGMLLGLVRDGRPVLGVVAMPALSEVYIGQKGKGATLNGAPIRCSTQTDLAAATLFINEGEHMRKREPALLDALLDTGSTRRLSYDCYPHALVASGHVDAVVDFNLQPYDYLPVVPLIEAAGGTITDWDGQPLTRHSDGRVITAATPELAAQMQKLVQKYRVQA